MNLMDFNTQKKADAGARMYVTNPATGEDSTMFFDIMGLDSKVYRAIEKRKTLDAVNKRKTKKKDATVADLDRIDEGLLGDLVELIVGLGDSEIDKDGKVHELDYIQENDRKLYATEADIRHILENYPPVREQMLTFLGDRANFL